MIKSIDYIRAWEERVGSQTAHLEEGDIVTKENLFVGYKKGIGRTNLSGTTVVDFGCGGGFCGEYLFAEKNIDKYIGIDIAQRAVFAATARLNDFNRQIVMVNPNKLPNFAEMNADVFVSFSCIHHFPDQEYLDYFLAYVNQSGIKKIFLSVKFAENNTFRDTPYKTTNDIGNACYTNAKYISSVLTNYKLSYKSSAAHGEYQYMRFNLIGAD